LHFLLPAGKAGPEILVLRVLPNFLEGPLEQVTETYFLLAEFGPMKDPQKGRGYGGPEIDARGDIAVHRDIKIP
jgi:hypothetical protein